MKLLWDDALERSSVVANCQMNRQRTLTGSNGYAKELRLNPLDVLLGRVGAKVRWLDLCCGEGKALVEAAQFVGNLDLSNIKFADGRVASRVVARELRQAGLEYDNRTKLLRCSRRTEAQLPFRYVGADDQAGPNYTKQPAVDSHYVQLGSERPSD